VTVAEGIEEREQLDLLRKLGCDLGQGYYLARPMPAARMAALFREASTGDAHKASTSLPLAEPA
jgi:EAL domain-containing protein (putative c-di-GMP-specific phosphodiesterase class I)